MLALALAAAAHFGYLALQPKAVVRSSIAPPEKTTFMTMPNNAAGPPVLSPDGAKLAFVALGAQSKAMLYVRPLSSLTAQPLAGTDGASYPFWSPDSRSLGFFAEGKLKKIEAGGGPPQALCDVAPNARGGAWGANGVILFSHSINEPLMRVAAAGGTPSPATKFDASRGENSHRWPWFLPDGKHFLFLVRSTRGTEYNGVYAGALDSTESKLLVRTETAA